MNTQNEKEQAYKLMKLTKDKRMFERYQTIYLRLSNMKINEISKIIHVQ